MPMRLVKEVCIRSKCSHWRPRFYDGRCGHPQPCASGECLTRAMLNKSNEPLTCLNCSKWREVPPECDHLTEQAVCQ